MSDGISQSSGAAQNPDRPFPGAPALAWTFVFVGVGYALPVLLATFWVGLHLLSSDLFGALRRIPWRRS